MNKVLGVEWRSAKDTVGLVLIEDEMGQQSGRIGAIYKVTLDGEVPMIFIQSAKKDAQYIADHGAKLSFTEAKAFFPWIKEENYKKS